MINKQKGFTLFETLVVISIIVLITAAVMVNFSGISQKARDGRRKSDLEKIRTALEMARQVTGSYPATKEELATAYISALPGDPKTGYVYVYTRPTLYAYTLDAYLEVEGGVAVALPATTCGGSPVVACNYRVANP
jgi:prepilin-type N-terminal cleavage/methylation domain-containing protein